ncbi:hypothetical protein MRP26_01230 [Bacillus sp. CCB-MMP212]|uniref:hypothetical protein n=1 Tax=Bacillus sp. CCB-MMP212 TaxID=2928002 RepID=UPI001F61FAF9|nr:hypothetical protein [Bacillus sp. CCB-MMP212]MCI4247585.1 hypothetical protein [Bacillus sp. CCB-MMP212]
MNRVILKELSINNQTIHFNEGLNYIVGDHGTGKNNLFRIIKYILGIKRDLELKGKCSLSLVCNFGDKEVNIIREYGSKRIVFETDSTIELRANSTELKEYYNILLEPFFKGNKMKNAGLNILSFGFLSPMKATSSIGIHIRRKELINTILGIDERYTKQLENDLEVIRKDVEKEEMIKQSIGSFIQGVLSEGLKKEELDKENLNIMSDIINQQYTQIEKGFMEKRLFLDKAQNAVLKIINEQKFYQKERMSLIEDYYSDLLKRIGVDSYINHSQYIKEDMMYNFKLFDHTSSLSSRGENEARSLCFMIALMRHGYDESHNGSGLIFDDIDYNFSGNMEDRLTDLINEEAINNSLQYIKTSRFKDREIPKEANIINLDNVKWGLL